MTDGWRDEAVRVMEAYTGAEAGYRRAHPRGIGVRGHFVADPDVSRWSVADVLQGGRTDVVVRLSNASGSPHAADRLSARRGAVLGLAVRFAPASGGFSTWAASNLSSFPARTPQEFVAATIAQRPGRRTGLPNPARLAWFLLCHPHSAAGFRAILGMPATPSFATTRFNGLNAFFLVDADGKRRAFRYHWTPEQGVARLTQAADPNLHRQYLTDEIAERLARGPVSWTLNFQLADPGDITDDVTKQWPKDRPVIRAGRLVLEGLHEDQALVEALVFDPNNLPPGLEPSDDPLLRFRSSVYAESLRRRSQER